MAKVNWRQVAAFGITALIVLLVAGSLMAPVWGWPGGGPMGGNGMMGGMMGGWGILGVLLMLVVPALFLALLVLGVIWLAKQTFPPPGGVNVAVNTLPCPHCGRIVQLGWRACPYCAGQLAGGPPEAPSQ